MREKLLFLAVLISACGGGGGASHDAGAGDAPGPPVVLPAITSLVPSPSTIPADTPTQVTWSWTYAVEPTLPDPVCSIDNGVGPVTRGQATTIRLTAVTTFTLTCTNAAGTAMRQVVLAIPPAAPLLGAFTATPSTLAVGTATNVTFAWSFANTPSPAPACMVEGTAIAAPNTAVSLTLAQARVYRLRCTNNQGAATLLVTVGVNECAAGLHDCQANATCVDTPESFTCQCNAGFTGNGDTCSAQVACGVTPTLCDPNATCMGGTACMCNAGYVGPGTTCQRMRVAFVTSTTGNGNLSTWVGAGLNTGVAAADAVCQTRATLGGLPGTYVAWMSDATSDAYCRVHGLTGKKANNCGQAALPVAAGPWVRPDGQPFAPTIDRLLAPTRATFRPASMNELGTEVAATDKVYTGTDDAGVLTSTACTDWTTNSFAVRGAMGEAHGGGTSWTDALALDPTCDTFGRLRCVQTTSGPALPSRHQPAKKAFLTSVTGTGNLSTWTDAGGLTGIAAADAVCQARARFVGYANSQNFKAWASNASISATSRFLTNGPWARPDGVVVAPTKSTLTTAGGRLSAALYLTETNAYVSGTTDAGSAWTGTSTSGFSTGSHCSSWSSTAFTGTTGRFDLADGRWVSATTNTGTELNRLYCLED
ncbi:MAG TPA: calcium-binding EGF-like domain-containing protein [Kofleriaceae bacterium]|nr:calcium-binding EGF-like domain-containing protein [Kofleriaceae bacterium]